MAGTPIMLTQEVSEWGPVERVLGGSPKLVAQAQKALVRVRSCAWTSRPMTGS